MSEAANLVGRDLELGSLQRRLEHTIDGTSGLAVVWGEPGIGKSRLLAELGRVASAREFLVLEGRAAEFERGLPYALVVDALDDYLASLDVPALERLAGEALNDLAPVFPSLRSLSDGELRSPTAAERFRTHHAIRDLIEGLGKRQPMLVALDDLHWADSASLEFAAHLLRRPPQGCVMIVAALRSGQAPPGVAAALDGAVRDGSLDEIQLSPLGPADAERLLADVRAADRERLISESGGNPFYLEQLAGTAAGATLASRGSGSVPPAVAAAIEAELDALSDPAQALAQGGAVAGDPFDIDLACAIAGQSDEMALEALDDLVAGGLARSTDVPRRFSFRHPLVRHAVYEAIPAGSRLSAHGRAAVALAERGAPAGARAHHIEAFARAGDEEAVALLREAAEQAAERDPETASRWYAAALRLLPERPGHPPRLGLLGALGASLAAAGRLAEAVDVFQQTLDELPEEPLSPRIELTIGCAAMELLIARLSDVTARLDGSLELVPPGSVEDARLRFYRALAAMYGGDYEGMRRWAEATRESAEGLELPAVKAKAAALLAYTGVLVGDAEAANLHERAQREMAELDDAELADDLDAMVIHASSSFWTDHYHDAVRESRRGIDVARASGRGQWVSVLTLVNAWAEARLGNLETARRRLDDAIDAFRLSGDPLGLQWSLGVRSRVAFETGDAHTALGAAEECLDICRRLGHLQPLTWTVPELAVTLVGAGQHQRARALLLEYAGDDALSFVPATERANYCALLAEASLALGTLEDAERWTSHAEEWCERLGLPLGRARARRARAALRSAGGDHAGAAEIAIRGAEAAEGVGALIDGAELRGIAGRELAAAGQSEAAIVELESAHEALAECGGERLRALVARELRRLGRRRGARTEPGDSQASGLAALSEREREVARLVRRRRTNPQIAEALFLSPKTVETHLRNIFRKLDVSSRVELAVVVEREEGVGTPD